MRKFKHFERQLALFGPTPVIGVELQAQFCDAVTEFGVLRSEGLLVETVTLKAVCGPGDEGEPVMTIMMPLED